MESNESIYISKHYMATKYSNHNSSMVGVIVWGYGEGQIVAKNLFDKIVLMELEGKKYKIPKGYKEWLTSIYGGLYSFFSD